MKRGLPPRRRVWRMYANTAWLALLGFVALAPLFWTIGALATFVLTLVACLLTAAALVVYYIAIALSRRGKRARKELDPSGDPQRE